MQSKVVEVDREKLVSVIYRALEQPFNTEIFIPCSSKKEQRDMHQCVLRELKTLSEIDPTDAASLSHKKVFKDSRFWIVLTHIPPALQNIYIKKDGVLEKEEV